MKNKRFCLAVNDQFGAPIEEQIGMIGEALMVLFFLLHTRKSAK